MSVKVLDKASILEAQDLETEKVEVPEWGGIVLVRGLTGTERDNFEASILRGQGKNMTVNMENLRAKLVARSAVGEDGARLFSDADAVALGKKSAAALSKVFTVAQKLSGLSDDDVKGLTEGLTDAPSDASISA